MVTSNRALHITSIIGIFCLLLLAGDLSYCIYHSLAWPLNGDASIEQYIAWRMLHGAAPYRDIYEADMPGTFLLHMFGITVFGSSDLAFRWFDLFICGMSTAGFLALGGKEARGYACAGGIVFTIFHISLGPGYMAERDLLMVPFLLFATVALRTFLNAPARFTPLFIFGLLTGYAFWIKPLAGAFVALSALVLMAKLRSARHVIKALAFIATGMLVPTTCILGWLYWLGALPALYDIIVHFAPIFVTLQAFERKDVFVGLGIGFIFLYGPVMYIFGYNGTRLPATDKTLLLMGMVYGVFNFFSQSFLIYHAYPLLAYVVLYFIWAVPILKGGVLEKTVLHAAFITLLISLGPWNAMSKDKLENFLPLVPYMHSTYIPEIKVDTDAALAQVPAAIREPFLLKTPELAIDFHGGAPSQLWAAAFHYHWVACSRQIYPYPMLDLFHSTYMDGWAKELLQDFSTVKPLVIVITPGIWPFKGDLVYDAIDHRQPWKAFFADNYILTKTTVMYRVYARVK